MGGRNKDLHAQSSTQIVRPGQPTVWGPDMTEVTLGHCSSTLADNTVIVTGGRRRSDPGGSARTEVYSFTTQQWTRKEDMNQRRLWHSCTTVWLDSHSHPSYGIIGGAVDNSSVLSVVVAGGELLELLPCFTISHTGEYKNGGGLHSVNSVEVYIPWNDTWLNLPPLPDLGDEAGRMEQTRIMYMDDSGGSHLYLLGGSRTDWNTGKTKVTRTVWRLMWHSGSQTYTWIDSYYTALGR